VKLWTIQAPEVAAQLTRRNNYRASWSRVMPSWIGAYEVMAAEMTARGIDCQGAPPAWAWPGWASPKQALYTADLLLGLDQWAHGVVMLRLAVPDDQVLCTSYKAWNDFLNPEVNRDGQPAAMDFRGVLLSKYDCLQATIPEIKARWVRRARPMPMSRGTRRQVLRDPYLRHLLIPPRADGSGPCTDDGGRHQPQ
jgi:hypothetical protein